MKFRYSFFVFIIATLLIINGCAAKSPLIQASSKNDSFTVQKLIEEGANINEVDKNGATPLMYASKSGKIETVKVLLNVGANIKIQDKQGYSALTHAISSGHEDVSRILIENHADVNAKDNYGDTPLVIASYKCNASLIKLLIDNGADINAKNSFNMNALHNTVQCHGPEKSYDLTKLLIDRGTDLTVKDNDGKTPLNYALEFKLIDTVALIRTKYQEDWNVNSPSVDDALRAPSRIKPEQGTYLIPQGKERAYNNAIIDCNDLVVPYRKGLLMSTGPIGYGLGLAADSITVKGKFQKCMEKMGFQCINNCSK